MRLKKSCSALEERLMLTDNVSRDEVKYFCHVTPKERYEDMKEKQVVRLTGSTVDRRVKLRTMKGLWTLVSLNKEKKLHNKSPYGDKRLQIAIDQKCKNPDDWLLFFDGTYAIGGGKYPTNQYIKLALVNKDLTREVRLCKKFMLPLNLEDNPFFNIRRSQSNATQTISTSIRSAVQRLCRQCGKHAKQCTGQCICKCGDGIVDHENNCEPTRKSTKLNLYVEVFIVNGITLDCDSFKRIKVVDVEKTGRGKGKIFDGKHCVADMSRFIVPSALFDKKIYLTFECLMQDCQTSIKDCRLHYVDDHPWISYDRRRYAGCLSCFKDCRFPLSSFVIIGPLKVLFECTGTDFMIDKGCYFKFDQESCTLKLIHSSSRRS